MDINLGEYQSFKHFIIYKNIFKLNLAKFL